MHIINNLLMLLGASTIICVVIASGWLIIEKIISNKEHKESLELLDELIKFGESLDVEISKKGSQLKEHFTFLEIYANIWSDKQVKEYFEFLAGRLSEQEVELLVSLVRSVSSKTFNKLYNHNSKSN